MARKQIIIMLSRVYPKKHTKAGEPTNFGKLLEVGRKIHTIRGNYDLWKVNEEKMKSGKYFISVRQWSGRPYHSKQVEIAQIRTPILVQRMELRYNHRTDSITAETDDKRWVDWMQIAYNDGMNTEDFKEWFFGKNQKEDKSFDGCVIHFKDGFQY